MLHEETMAERLARAPSLGMSSFAFHQHLPDMGNSYTTLHVSDLIELTRLYWDNRVPGNGETGLDRKVVVTIEKPTDLHGKPLFYCPPRVKLQPGMPVCAEVVTRQEGEDPYVETFITPEVAKQYGVEAKPAALVRVVCYSVEALLENNGKRTTSDDWEIVCLLCSSGEKEPMTPLTMARNMLEKTGGTYGEYTNTEFAEAIWYWSNVGIKVRPPKSKM